MRPEYGKVSSAGSTICTTWPCAPLADSCASVARTSAIGLQKSDSTTISASGDGANDGGRLARSVGSCTIAFGHPVDARCGCRSAASGPACRRARRLRPAPRRARRRPPARGRAWSRCASGDAERHRGRAVGPEPDRVRGLPFLLAHVEMVVAGGAAPVDAARRLARDEAAELPEVLARAGAAAAVQAVDDGGGDRGAPRGSGAAWSRRACGPRRSRAASP